MNFGAEKLSLPALYYAKGLKDEGELFNIILENEGEGCEWLLSIIQFFSVALSIMYFYSNLDYSFLVSNQQMISKSTHQSERTSCWSGMISGFE